MDARLTADLVGRAAEGESSAYEQLVDEFSPLVWSVARGFRLSKADAQDVSQVVWLRLVENLGKLREPERVGAWLAVTARHECLAFVKRSSRTTTMSSAGIEALDRPADGAVDGSIMAGVRVAAVQEAMVSLPSQCQRLFQLMFSDPPAAYDAIAASLEIAIGSIGPTRQRCLDRLRRHPAILRISESLPASEGSHL